MPQTYNPACHAPGRTGLVDIQVGIPFSAALATLGHATDVIDTQERAFYHDVPGDRNGGPQGPPIEIQYLGGIYVINFRLSSYNATTIALLRKRSINATLGVVLQSEIGDFMLTTNGIRLLLMTEAAGDVRNFWTCLVREPIQVGAGTKYSEWVFSFEAHRPPCGHAKAGILMDSDSDAFS